MPQGGINDCQVGHDGRGRRSGLDDVCQRSQRGFTLVELIIVILVVGIMAAVSIPVVGNMITNSKRTATKEEMQRLVRGAAGSDAGSNCGFEGDVGFLPSQLVDLTKKPDSVAAWNAFTHVGWNGPYIDSANGDYLTDAWGQSYTYTPSARTIESSGAGTPITLTY